MRQFVRPMGMERLSLEARVLYSAFCVFVIIGLATSAWLYSDSELGASPASARRYYVGDTTTAAAERTPSAGPALELPADAEVTPLHVAKSPRQLLETLHFHIFSMPIVLLILGHLFMMCELSLGAKTSILVLASAATLVHVLAPPLIGLVHPGFAVLVFPSALTMAVTWLALALWPLIEMWRKPQPE